MTAHRKLIALDFDGVLHSYLSPWTDAATIADPPTPGAMEFLKALVEDDRFDVVIVSSRCSSDAGKRAIDRWIREHLENAFGEEFFRHAYTKFDIVSGRPPAFLTIDDRAHQFTATWPDLDVLAAFKPWNKRPAAEIQPIKDRRFDVHSNRLFDPDATIEAANPGAALDAFLRAGPRGEPAWPRFPDVRRVRIDGPEGTMVFSTDAKGRWCAVHPDDLHRGWLAPKGEHA